MLTLSKTDKCYAYELESAILESIKKDDMQAFQVLLDDYLGRLFHAYEGNHAMIRAKLYEISVLIHRVYHEYVLEIDYDLCQYANDRISRLQSQKHMFDFVDTYVRMLNLQRSYQAKKSTRALIDKAKCYIDENFTDNISLERVAGEIGVSPYYLCRKFSHYEQITFGGYIKHKRISEAKRLLTETEDSITLIVEKVGYRNQAYFGSVFKNMTGVTASQYRKERVYSGTVTSI